MNSCIVSLVRGQDRSYVVHMSYIPCCVVAPSLSVLRIGSMEVGALLNDAYKEYEVINGDNWFVILDVPESTPVNVLCCSSCS